MVIINPLFEMFALRQINTEYMNDTKQTMIEAIVLADLSVDSNKDKEQLLKDNLNSLFNEVSKTYSKNDFSGSRK